MKNLDMNMTQHMANGAGWAIEEDLTRDAVMLVVHGEKALFRATELGCAIMIPESAIDAIRAMKPKQIPHLREKRAKALTARAKHGWETRRKNGGA